MRKLRQLYERLIDTPGQSLVSDWDVIQVQAVQLEFLSRLSKCFPRNAWEQQREEKGEKEWEEWLEEYYGVMGIDEVNLGVRIF